MSEAAAATLHYGRAPKERSISSGERSLVEKTPTKTSAARRARSKVECCASFQDTASACAPAPCGTHGAGLALEAAADTPYRARSLKRRRRLASAAFFGRIRTDQNDRGTARTQSKLECCASSPETASVHAPAPREPRGAGMKLEAAAGTSHHGRDEGGESLAVAASFGRVRTDHNHRDTTRTRSKLECCVSSLETASTDAPAPQEPLGAGLKFEAAGSTSHPGRAPKERVPSRRCGIFLRDTSRSQPARHRTRVKQARVLRLLPRDSERRRTCAARATRRWLEVGGRS